MDPPRGRVQPRRPEVPARVGDPPELLGCPTEPRSGPRRAMLSGAPQRWHVSISRNNRMKCRKAPSGGILSGGPGPRRRRAGLFTLLGAIGRECPAKPRWWSNRDPTRLGLALPFCVYIYLGYFQSPARPGTVIVRF